MVKKRKLKDSKIKKEKVASTTQFNEHVAEFNAITSTQYNEMSKEGKKSMKNTIVRFADSRCYHINKDGNLIRMLKQPSFEPEDQKELKEKYQHELLLQKQREEQFREKLEPNNNVPVSVPKSESEQDLEEYQISA